MQPEAVLELHNTQEGRVFMLGNGPSLISQLPLLDKLSDEATFGCNHLLDWDVLPFKPTYYGYTDSREDELGPMVYANENLTRFHVWSEPSASVLYQWVERKPLPGWIRVEGFVGLGDELPALSHGRTSPLTLSQLAAWMGFREFYFLGIDGTTGHCYNPHDPGIIMDHRERRGMIKNFEAARAAVESVGGTMHDCTPGGILNPTRSEYPPDGCSGPPALEYRDLAEVLLSH